MRTLLLFALSLGAVAALTADASAFGKRKAKSAAASSSCGCDGYSAGYYGGYPTGGYPGGTYVSQSGSSFDPAAATYIGQPTGNYSYVHPGVYYGQPAGTYIQPSGYYTQPGNPYHVQPGGYYPGTPYSGGTSSGRLFRMPFQR